MTTAEPTFVTSEKPAPVATKGKTATPKSKVEPEMITLDALCREFELVPREARMMLRLAVKKKGEFPNLAKDHEPRAPWQWTANSKGLIEARRALTELAAS